MTERSFLNVYMSLCINSILDDEARQHKAEDGGDMSQGAVDLGF